MSRMIKVISPDTPDTQQQAAPANGTKSIMVAIDIPDDITQQLLNQGIEWPMGTEPTTADQMHITLACFNDEETIDRALLESVVAQTCADYNPLIGRLNGIGRFLETHKEGMHCIYLNFDCPGLSELRNELVSRLAAAGITVMNNHGFSPHMTYAYIPAAVDFPIPNSIPVMEFKVAGLSVFWRDDPPVIYLFNIPVPPELENVPPALPPAVPSNGSGITKRQLLKRFLKKVDWEEDKHPRANDGKFTSGAGGGGGRPEAKPKTRSAPDHATSELSFAGPGSGNFGHAGRPGLVGGSASDSQANKDEFNGGNPYIRYTTTPDTPMSDWGHAMFADKKEKVDHNYGKYAWYFDANSHKDVTVTVDSIKEDIKKAFLEDVERGYWVSDTNGEFQYFIDAYNEGEMPIDEFLNQFSPEDIVNSAEAYDTILANWLYQEVLESKGITAIVLPDGVIVYDESIITRI